MNIKEKLQNFKRKIESPTITNDELAILIGTELYEYIRETSELKKEFNHRFYFLDKLSEKEINNKTRIASVRLHTKQFQHFKLDCAEVRSIEGLEGYYLKSGGKLYDNRSIKKSALVVIDDLIETIEKDGGSNITAKNKTTLKINKKNKTISKDSIKNLVCSFRKVNGKNKRFDYIVKLAQNEKIGGSKLSDTSAQNLSTEIGKINMRLINDLDLTHNVIKNDNNSGYEIDRDFYEPSFD